MSGRMRLTRILSQMGRRKPKPVVEKHKWNIVRGDKVQVIGAHPEAGKQGKVLEVVRKLDRVIVEGINLAPKHIKGNAERGIKGRTIQKERTIPYCNLSLIDPVTNKPTRVSKQYLDDGTKVRVSKKSGTVIPRPDILTFRRRPVNSLVTESCTAEEDAWEITYQPTKNYTAT